MSKYEAPADDFPKKKSSGSSSRDGYTVEARLAYVRPDNVGGMLLDTRWQQVHFANSPIGVPGDGDLVGHGLLTYQQAQSLRWWFIAEAAKQNKQFCLETRLVKHRLTYSYEVTTVSAHALIGSEDRSSIMPDWGKKEAAE